MSTKSRFYKNANGSIEFFDSDDAALSMTVERFECKLDEGKTAVVESAEDSYVVFYVDHYKKKAFALRERVSRDELIECINNLSDQLPQLIKNNGVFDAEYSLVTSERERNLVFVLALVFLSAIVFSIIYSAIF